MAAGALCHELADVNDLATLDVPLDRLAADASRSANGAARQGDLDAIGGARIEHGVRRDERQSRISPFVRWLATLIDECSPAGISGPNDGVAIRGTRPWRFAYLSDPDWQERGPKLNRALEITDDSVSIAKCPALEVDPSVGYP